MAKHAESMNPPKGWLGGVSSVEDAARAIVALIEKQAAWHDPSIVLELDVELIEPDYLLNLDVLSMVSSLAREIRPEFRLAARLLFTGKHPERLADEGNSLLTKADELAPSVSSGRAAKFGSKKARGVPRAASRDSF